MRILLFRSIFMASLASLPISIMAQTASTPPVLEKLDEGEPPAITIKPSSPRHAVTEKREGGKVTEVKVKKGKNNYTLKPNTPAGTSLPGDAESSGNRAAQWDVTEFDLGTPLSKEKTPPPAQK